MNEEQRAAIDVVIRANVASEAVAKFVREVNDNILLADQHGLHIAVHAAYALLSEVSEEIADLVGADIVSINIDDAEELTRRIRLHAEQN